MHRPFGFTCRRSRTSPSEAAEIGRGTEHAEAMAAFDARFEVEFDDLEDALDEINTLMEVQGALQDASQGYLFLPWNANICKPWRREDRT
jgi:hypothetical protein